MPAKKDILLSICICALPVRIAKLYMLIHKLNMQILTYNADDKVEILVIMDSKTISVGKKRNMLVDMAQGKYITFVDDDDAVSEQYVSSILDAVRFDADVITFEGKFKANNSNQQDYVYTYLRPDMERLNVVYSIPNHITAIKAEIAKKCHFPDANVGEVEAYANLINKYVTSEYHIKKDLYLYDYNSSLSQTIGDDKNRNTAYREISVIL